jgi:hypothetical protein
LPLAAILQTDEGFARLAAERDLYSGSELIERACVCFGSIALARSPFADLARVPVASVWCTDA